MLIPILIWRYYCWHSVVLIKRANNMQYTQRGSQLDESYRWALSTLLELNIQAYFRKLGPHWFRKWYDTLKLDTDFAQNWDLIQEIILISPHIDHIHLGPMTDERKGASKFGIVFLYYELVIPGKSYSNHIHFLLLYICTCYRHSAALNHWQLLTVCILSCHYSRQTLVQNI